MQNCQNFKDMKSIVGNSLVRMKSMEEIPGCNSGGGTGIYTKSLTPRALPCTKLRSVYHQFTFCDFLTFSREVDVNILVIFFKELIFAINQSSSVCSKVFTRDNYRA